MRESERAALACTRGVIANSPATARTLAADYGVPRGAHHGRAARHGSCRCRAAQTARPRSRCSPSARWCRARATTLLIEALAALIDLPWRLTIVGDCWRDPATAARLKADIARHRLGPRVTIEDAVPAERLAALYAVVRPVRAALALRGLRHGLRRGDRAWPAGDRHDRRRHSRYRPGRLPACWCRRTMCRRWPPRCGG